MDKNNLFRWFNIVKGCSGFDILKCEEIADKYREFQKICEKHKIGEFKRAKFDDKMIDNWDHRWDWKNRPDDMIRWIREKI
jgi:hypothetical protein